MAVFSDRLNVNLSFSRSMTLQGLVAAVVAPAVIGLALLLPFAGAIAFALGYEALVWLGWVAWVPPLGWVQAFLLGGLAVYGSGYLRGGHVAVTPWLTMLFAGAVHHDVFPQVPAFGFLAALGLYVPFFLVRFLYSDSSDEN